MIDTSKYERILNEGLLLDHYFILSRIQSGETLPTSRKVIGMLNLLAKKGYMDNNVITPKALELLEKEIVEVKTVVKFEPLSAKLAQFDYATWIIGLHKKCKDKLTEVTGKAQVAATIGGKRYSFLPNSTDLGRVILRAIRSYNLRDYEKIEKTILAYVEKSAKTDSWFPILGYYIMKDNLSKMVTDMENQEEEQKDNDTIVNI